MKLVSVEQMRAVERNADASGLTYAQMMDNAGRRLAETVLALRPTSEVLSVAGLVGPGNNGGDTLVALAQLALAGWTTKAYLVSRPRDSLVKRLLDAGGQSAASDSDPAYEVLGTWIKEADFLLDGVLGTGIQLPLKEGIRAVLAAAHSLLAEDVTPPFVVAVDCPSGIDCDTGEMPAETLPADLTVTMAAVKQGLLKLPAFERIGELKVVDIGLSSRIQDVSDVSIEVADQEGVTSALPPRPLDAHKGTFGTALIVAGSINYTGAAILAGRAAYRVGAGLVRMAVPAPLHGALAGHFPEATWVLLPHELGAIAPAAAEVLRKNLAGVTALLIGPGLGLEATTGEFLQDLLGKDTRPTRSSNRIGFLREVEPKSGASFELPGLVFDADGLKLLARNKEWQTLIPPMTILTPHPGEMSALTGLSKEEIQGAREKMAARYAAEWGHVLVLKGAFTMVAAPDGRLTVIPAATPALARAGTGDVLAGLIVGLRAQGVHAFEAAVAGAWIHARAGMYAASDIGTTASVLAGDVLDSVSDVMSDLA